MGHLNHDSTHYLGPKFVELIPSAFSENYHPITKRRFICFQAFSFSLKIRTGFKCVGPQLWDLMDSFYICLTLFFPRTFISGTSSSKVATWKCRRKTLWISRACQQKTFLSANCNSSSIPCVNSWALEKSRPPPPRRPRRKDDPFLTGAAFDWQWKTFA